MLKKTIVATVILISTASHALTRADDTSLSAGKIGIQHSEASSAPFLESDSPRPMSFEEDDATCAYLSPYSHGVIARTHRTAAKKSLHGTSAHAERPLKDDGVKYKIYRVRKGDTLYSIARKFHMSPDVLSERNNISSSSALVPGQRLKIPTLKKNVAEGALKKDDESTREYSSIRFAWPLRRIISVSRDEANGVRPLGIVLEGAPGSAVVCAAKGTVEKIGSMRGFGRYIIIKHESHFLTVYSGLKDIYVQEGDEVQRNKKIGTHEGSIHFQINRAGRPINPLELLPDRGSSYSALAR